MSNGDQGPDVPVVNTPDLAASGKLEAVGQRTSGIWPYVFASFWATLKDGLQKFITVYADTLDEMISLIVPFITASQGSTTQGFYDLTAAMVNDLLGVEVAGSDLSDAADNRGRIPAMQNVGRDLIFALVNEFLGNATDAGPGGGPGGLPGSTGQQLTPEQGVKGAQAFVGFLLSFAVRQGNVAVLTDALSFKFLGQMREYGEMMAKNLGLSRLARRALTPIVQTLIATPLQQALNFQYRPHVLDAKQLASAYIRGDIDRSDYATRLQYLGFTDGDINLLIEDTYTRLRVTDVFLLAENGVISESDLVQRLQALGYNTIDVPLLRQARELEAVQGADRKYAEIITEELVSGQITEGDYQSAVSALRIPKLEADAITRNAAARLQTKRKQLSLGFVKKAYLDGQMTIDELLAHAKALGYSQDDIDLIEVEVLFQQSEKKAAAAAKAAKAAAKLAGKTPGTPTTGA